MSYTLEIHATATALPIHWDNVVGQHNRLLSTAYFKALDEAKPTNMRCYYIGFYRANQLIGGALVQHLQFNNHNSFQNKRLGCSIKNFLAKRYSKDVLILGNNMLTGQNGFYFNLNEITPTQGAMLMEQALQQIQAQTKKASLVIYKDYQKSMLAYFQQKMFKPYFTFSVQPNMVLDIKKSWFTFQDYLADFSAKYRTRINLARKKKTAIEKKELTLEDIKAYKHDLHKLYNTVAENASFNTFFLPENHFEKLKQHLNQNFKVFGYLLNNKLVGFCTLIINNKDIDTYFLGYDKAHQKELQLYFNMVLDMVEYGIDHRFDTLILGRTALEIKSTIGAEPVEIFGLIKHNHTLVNKFISFIFNALEPKTEWIQRKPFKQKDK